MALITSNYVIIIIITVAILCWIYIKKSPTWEDKARLTLALAFIPIIASSIWFIKKSWDHSELTNLEIIPLLVAMYFLISIFFVLFASWKKGGYDNLKKISEFGLIAWLIGGLVSGLAGGSLVGFVLGLTGEMISGLVFGLILGLSYGLIFGLIFGMTIELKK
jgi:hypothetical protein